MAKKVLTLHRMRAEIEARVSILRKTRFENCAIICEVDGIKYVVELLKYNDKKEKKLGMIIAIKQIIALRSRA